MLLTDGICLFILAFYSLLVAIFMIHEKKVSHKSFKKVCFIIDNGCCAVIDQEEWDSIFSTAEIITDQSKINTLRNSESVLFIVFEKR